MLPLLPLPLPPPPLPPLPPLPLPPLLLLLPLLLVRLSSPHSWEAARAPLSGSRASWILACLATFAVSGCNPAAPARPTPTSSTVAGTASAPAATPSASTEPAVSAKAANDGAIDALAKRLSTSHGLWANGHAPKLDSPAGASTFDVLTELFGAVSFDKGKVSSFEILEERDVKIAGDARPYRAVRLDTDRGKMVVLLRFHMTSWWARAYLD